MLPTAYFKEYLSRYQPYKSYWNYEDGCVLKGCIDLYEATGDTDYRDFVLRYLSQFVAADGDIPNYEREQYNIDSINSGKALFFAYEQTGEDRYRKAIELHMRRLREHPRCQCGSFWHKTIYPNQIWLDGLYMAQPFYMEYEMKFGTMAHVDDILAQFANVRRLLYNADKGLYYHAYDEACAQPWADRQTGLSPNFWLRSIGWLLMALCDCAALIDEQLYDRYRALCDQLSEAVRGVLTYQDEATGLFYQVVDHPEHPGNYLETSGSAMIAYAIMKGVRIGALNRERYAPVGARIFDSLQSLKLTQDEHGETHLCDICKVAGLGPGEKRDGSVAYYLSEPRTEDDSKGVGPFMMACAERIRQLAQ